jgi:phage shock protein PspC (stress-responsive transcriptional regulator)
MKKTISINISGVVFNIEEDAYEDLRKYLDTIAGYFTDSDGREEIMTDIEARIAELFQARLSEAKNVVGMQDVQEVIDIMGRPEDYLGEEEQERSYAQSAAGQRTKRRLYRDDEKGLIAGVCTGISHYFGWDPIWIRLAWGFSIVFAGVGILPYIILWIIIPAAKTTSEKLEMMGEPINVESIKKKVNETVSSIRESGASGLDTDFQASYARDQVKRGGNLVVDLLKRFVRFIGRLLGFLFFVGGVALAAFLIYSYFDGTWFQGIMTDKGFGFSDFNDVLFTSNLNTYSFIIGLVLFTLVPLIAFILLGVWLLFSIKSRSRVLIPTMLGLWIIGLVMLIISGLSLGKEFTVDRYATERDSIASTEGVLFIQLNENNHFSESFKFYRNGRHTSELIALKGDRIVCGFPEFNISRNTGDRVELEIERLGRGFTSEAAMERAENIVYSYQLEGDTLRLDPFFSFLKTDKFRGQELEVTLKLPIGKRVFLGEHTDRILYHARTAYGVSSRDLMGQEWIMTKDGLTVESDINEIPNSETVTRLDSLN